MKNVIVLVSLILFSFTGCKKELTAPEYNDPDIYSYLPLKVGNYWEYDYSDIASRAVIKREIKNTLIHEDGSKIYGYYEGLKVNNPNPIEPIAGYFSAKENAIYYYSYSKDTMVISGFSLPTSKIPVIKNPLSIGATWVVKSDTFTVNSFSSIEVNNSVYHNTVLIIRKNKTYTDSTWFAKNVGMIRLKGIRWLGGDSNYNVEMKLRKYSLK